MLTTPPFRNLSLILLAALVSPLCLADRVQIPLGLDHRFLESLLRQQVFTGAGDSVRLNDDGSGCRYLKLSQPAVTARAGNVNVRVTAEARVGRALGDRCLLVADWGGQLELVQEPVVTADGGSVSLRTSSWRALRPDGSTDTVSTTIGNWVEQFLPLDLKQTRISFVEPLSQLEELLAQVLITGDTGSPAALLDAVTIDEVDAGNDRVIVTLGVEAPQAAAQAAPDEPELSAAELAQLEQRLDAVDAFFTYVIKSISRGSDAPDPNESFEVLLALRRELVSILSEPERRPTDPARTLFVDAWAGLVPILEDLAEQEEDYDSALRYLTFIGAGDALRALDELGPAVGLDISSDGLRRLARILVQRGPDDPLQRDEAVDPELRRSLGFGEPLPPPQGGPGGADTSWLDWLVPRVVAADTLDPSLVKRLNNWVPRTRDMDEYLPMVRDVLRHVVTQQLLAGELDEDVHPVFRWLVFAAAWQESCWRQFTAEDDMRVPVQSASGDLGLMQINARVWRGLYDLHGLRWDIVYNARAGADILEHYLVDYAIRHGEDRQGGGIDNLARSAYAAYNGGPRQYDRYRRADVSPHGSKVDSLFHEKYQEVKRGKEMAVAACYSGQATTLMTAPAQEAAGVTSSSRAVARR